MRQHGAVGFAALALALAAGLFAAAPSRSVTSPKPELGPPEAGVSYLLLDARSGAILESHWERMNQATPLGSLVKPFTALAYAQTHGYRYPKYDCDGKSAGCWWPAGHGRIGIEAAVSHSCNVYFRLLAERVNYRALSAVAWRLGIAPPDSGAPSLSYVGLGGRWQVAPLAMARAYLELVRRGAEPGVVPVLDGMRESAASGTGSGIGEGAGGNSAWGKTGTAPCTHSPAADGDGFAVAIYPAPQPKYVLLLRKHGVPGRLAAVAAGRMLAAWEGVR